MGKNLGKYPLTNNEYAVMEYIWKEPGIPAAEVEAKLRANGKDFGKNFYNYLNHCIEKGALARRDPGYHCCPLIDKSEASHKAASFVAERFSNGSRMTLIETLVRKGPISKEEAEKLKLVIDSMKEDDK